MSYPKLIDNSRHTLKAIIEQSSSSYRSLSIATGYWDLLGTSLIFKSIKEYDKIRLLIGREPMIPRHMLQMPEPDYPDRDFFKDLEALEPKPELKKLVQDIKRLIEKGILEIRVYRKSFFHAKSYIFGDYSDQNAIGIIGSSNFTKNGLTHNTELNALESDHRIVTFRPLDKGQDVGHLFWFDQFWENEYTEKWDESFSEIISESPVGDILFSPYEVYIKTLYEFYKDELKDEKLGEHSFSSTYDLTDFQIKNAKSLIRRLKKRGTAILADSVGLGKTFTAIEVVKQYLHTDEGRKRVEIICPKSLVEQWRRDLTQQGVLNLDVNNFHNLNAIKKKKELDHIANVSLFVIDESHNLKNRLGKRFDEIVNWIRANPRSHVLMLTATPISNQLSDITNQLILGTGGETDVLKVIVPDKNTMQTTPINFHKAIEDLQKKVKKDLKQGKIDEKHIRETMRPILREFVVRRTRQGIKKEYGSLKIKGKSHIFPKVYPKVEKYLYEKETTENLIKSSRENDFFNPKEIYKLSVDSIIDNTKKLVHPLDNLKQIKPEFQEDEILEKSPIYLMYQTILFLNFIPYKWETYKKSYYGKTREELRNLRLSSDKSKKLFLQIGIYGILRTMFLKRIESSLSALEMSLETYERKLNVFEKGLAQGKIISVKDLSNIEEKLGLGDEDIARDDLEIEEDDILDDSVTEGRYNIKKLEEDIKKEKSLVALLKDQVKVLRQDNAKIDSFVQLVKTISKEFPEKKILVFSYYADTIHFLEKKIISPQGLFNPENSAFLSSKNRRDAENLAGRFSPQSRGYKMKEDEKEIKYLFSTDILSEGQNLQDCGIVVNYDLHWSPIRMIQRNGRINRLGTPFDEVFVYNISPEKQLDEYLKLVHRLESKIKVIRSSIGTDTPVLDEDENPIEFTDTLKDIYSEDLNRRMDALKKAEHEADFLLAEDDYISDLKLFDSNKIFDKSYKKKIYGIPSGKWGVMPQSSFRGGQKNPRPDVLVYNEFLGDENKVIGRGFVSADVYGGKIEFISNLQAFEWLRADLSENKRETDQISINKIELKKTISKGSKTYTKEESVTPIGQESEVLRIMHEGHFSEDDINLVSEGLNTTNVLDEQQIKKLIRKIMQKRRNGNIDTNSIKQIVSICKSNISKKSSQEEAKKTKQVLFYVRKNG